LNVVGCRDGPRQEKYHLILVGGDRMGKSAFTIQFRGPEWVISFLIPVVCSPLS
uniref:Uncharacterized protein n=1 Tax=Naja naja TaxID=35670 RepID=A0A8C6X936_NAJNA